MALDLTSLTQLADLGFDEIIDVRAPAEFAEDHVPGAISLPVLDDDADVLGRIDEDGLASRVLDTEDRLALGDAARTRGKGQRPGCRGVDRAHFG